MNRSLPLVMVTRVVMAGTVLAAMLDATLGCGGGAVSESPASGASLPLAIDKDQTITSDIDLLGPTTVAPGVTLTLGVGAKLHAVKGAALVIKGTLLASGATGNPVVFEGREHGAPDGWVGIEVASAGKITLKDVEIHDATLALQADEGSSYTIDGILVDTSSQLALLKSDGTIAHGQLHGLGGAQMSSPFTVDSASPQVSNTVLDKGAPGAVDYVIVNGATAKPVFDHVEVADSHCAFHFNAGKDVKLTNSFIHDSSYGIMVIGSVGTVVEGNNFEKNGVNIGTCSTGDVTSAGNYFGGGDAFDASCKAQVDTGAASARLPGAGPRF